MKLEASGAWAIAQELYKIGTRHYHTFEHALDVLGRVDKFEKILGYHNYEAVRVAALFHDAVYVVGAPPHENETSSAEAMKKAMYQANQTTEILELINIIDDAHNLIMATSLHMTHQRFFHEWDTMVFMDCDMLGFAATWEGFQRNNAQIDAEFASAPTYDEEKYKIGRVEFLMKLYKKGIFRSPYIKATYEETALSNIRMYLKDLGVVV